MALEKIVEVIKAHPAPVIGGAIIVVLLMRMGSVSGSIPQNQSGAQLSIVGMQTGVQSQQIATNGQVALSEIDSKNSAIRAAASNDQFNTIANLASVLDNNSSISKTAQNTSMLQYLTNQSAINSQSNLQQMQITNNHAENMTNMQNQLTALQMTTNAAVGADNHQFILGSRTIDLQNKSLELTAQNLPAIFQHEETMSQIAGNTAATALQFATFNHALSNQGTQPQNTVANAAADASKNNSNMQTLSTVASIAAMVLL